MITLGLLGFDAAFVKSLSIALRSRAAKVCQYVEPEAASVVLVDIDNLQDQNVWKQLKETYSSILIAASQNLALPAGYEQDFVSVIDKPIRFTAMLAAINAAVTPEQEPAQFSSNSSVASEQEPAQFTGKSSVASEQEPAQFTGKSSVVSEQEPAQFSSNDSEVSQQEPVQLSSNASVVSAQESAQPLSNISMVADLIDNGRMHRNSDVLRSQTEIDPDNFLLGFVLYSAQLDSPDHYRYICLDEGHPNNDGQWLVIDKRLNRVYLSINAKVIRHTAIMDFSHQGVIEQWITESQLAELKSRAVQNISIEEFIWVLTRDTIRNARLMNFDTEKCYRLKCWPNLTRYATGNRDIAMASFWIESNASTVELANNLGLTLDDVLPFATCCFTCGLLEPVDEPVPMPTRKQGRGLKKVLSMILKKLER